MIIFHTYSFSKNFSIIFYMDFDLNWPPPGWIDFCMAVKDVLPISTTIKIFWLKGIWVSHTKKKTFFKNHKILSKEKIMRAVGREVNFNSFGSIHEYSKTANSFQSNLCSPLPRYLLWNDLTWPLVWKIAT